MLTKGDDYPIHQTAEPVAVAGTDRNFYDRYFFNGYSPDGETFFAAALGVYPHLAVMDAAFSVNRDGRQQSVIASRRIKGGERMDTEVSPLAVEIVEPLKKLRVTCDDAESGLKCDLTCTARAAPIEEPRFIRRTGTRTVMDVTRMTQAVEWSGWLEVDGKRHEVSGWWGTRDRSWGVRPVGAGDQQPALTEEGEPANFQFYWLWSPVNFPDHALFFHTNDDADGHGWNRAARLITLSTGEMREISLAPTVSYKPGTRNAATATLEGDGLKVEFDLGRNFHMFGIGYGHPSRGHGTDHGAHSVHREAQDLADVDLAQPQNNHVQALAAVTLTLPDGTKTEGRGILEQLYIGPHAPSGFTSIFDLA